VSTPTDADEGNEEGLDPQLVLDPVEVRAEPGGQVQISLKVRNPGRYVESYLLHVNGLPQDWWNMNPPEVPVYAHDDGTATLQLTPPPDAQATAEPLPFAVCVVSQRDERLRVAEEGELEVGRVFTVNAGIIPVTSSVRWTGRHILRITNWGNGPVTMRLFGMDKDDRLGFLVRPEVVTVPVGNTVPVSIRVRPRKPFLRGAPQHVPFQVIGLPDDSGLPSGGGTRAGGRGGTGMPHLPGVPGVPGAGAVKGRVTGAAGNRASRAASSAVGGGLAGQLLGSLARQGVSGAASGAFAGGGGGGPVGPAVPAFTPADVTAAGGFVVDGAVVHKPVLPKLLTLLVVLGLVGLVAGITWLVKTSQVKGALQTDIQPSPPTKVVVAPLSPTSLQVSWSASPRTDVYAVQRVDPTSGNPMGEAVQVKAPGLSTQVKIDKPLTKACYTVQAFRNDIKDIPPLPSKVKCATSFDDALPPPQGVKAVVGGPGQVTVSWKRVADTKHLVLLGGRKIAAADVGEDAVQATVPGGKTCVQVVAVSGTGNSSSDPVDAPCVDVPLGASTSTVTGTTSPTTSAAATTGSGTTKQGSLSGQQVGQTTGTATASAGTAQVKYFILMTDAPITQAGTGPAGTESQETKDAVGAAQTLLLSQGYRTLAFAISNAKQLSIGLFLTDQPPFNTMTTYPDKDQAEQSCADIEANVSDIHCHVWHSGS